MKLSIIIPTFNSSAVLNRALDSIVSQTFIDWEVLIMDGKSTDNTIEVAQSYNDSRILIYSESDNGIYDAMNKGIRKSSGEWLYFLGSDDYLLTPNVLTMVFNQIDNWYDIIYGDVQSPVLPELYRGAWSIDKLYANRCHQAIFYRRNLFRKIGLYNLKYPYLADFEFNLRWFLNKHINNEYCPIDVAYFSSGGVSENQKDPAFWDDFDYLVIKYGYPHLNTTQKKQFLTKAIEKEKHWVKRNMMSLLLLYNTIKGKIKSFLNRNPHNQ